MNDDEIRLKVVNTYHVKLLREPDKERLQFWFNEIKSGRVDVNSLASTFESLDEFRKLEDLRKGYTITKEGFDLFLDPQDWVISRALSINKVWEPEETKFFRQILHEEMTVVDVGANIGYFTVLFSKIVGERGRVISFEPDPGSYSILQKNVKENNLANVLAIQKAVADFCGKAKLYLSKTNHGDNRMSSTIIEDIDIEREVIDVDVTSLDDALKDINIDFLKIDTQGAEMKVINGAQKMIKRNKNLKIALEFWPIGLRSQMSEPSDLLSKLREMGFDIYDMKEKVGMKNISNEELCAKYAGKSFTNLYCVKNK